MESPYSVVIPLINPNEPEARLASLLIDEGQQVTKGDTLCILETTKSTFELEAELDGYVVGLNYELGQIALAGDILCHLAPSADWQLPESDSFQKDTETALPEGLRISQPALELIKTHDIDPGGFPEGSLITTKMVQELIDQEHDYLVNYNPTTIIIYGGGGHCKSLIDVIKAIGTYTIAGILDDGIPPDQMVMGIRILGGKGNLPNLRRKGIALAVNAVGGIGNLSSRVRVFQFLADNGFICPQLIHPSAFVEQSASVSDGVQVFPQAYVGSEAEIGFGTIINTGAIISHDCKLDEYVNISPGAILAGEVHVGEEVLIGMGATINLQVKVGRGARIGNNATVKSNVPENGIVRAGAIWPD